MISPGTDTHGAQGPQADLLDELLRQRYFLKDAHGRPVEDTEQMLHRVASAVAASEEKYGSAGQRASVVAAEFLRLMSHGLFLPNSPTLMNAGRPGGMLDACFVLGIEDSVEGIFEAVKLTALVQKAGGGTGFALDTLRPTGDYVASSGGTTSGPISFWRVFSETTKAVQQGAHRRGAGMAMLSVSHPDILAFLSAKQDPRDFVNFNISVKIPDEFMATLRSRPDSPHMVVNPRNGQRYLLPRSLDVRRYELHDLLPVGRTDQPCHSVADVWNLLVTNAHATGEPGVCFIDRVNRDNPTPALGPIQATNPCGEQPLLPGEACCLGSIDVSKFVGRGGHGVDWSALGETVKWSVRFLDNVVDATGYPAPAIRQATLGNRKIGLGMMGFADALLLLGIRYDSDEAAELARKLSQFIQESAHQASQDLAAQRGSFPNWAGSVWDTEHHRPMRNACCTTIAPTGSLSILAQCSAGIEPIYSLACRRRALDRREFIYVHPLLERIGQREGWMTDAVRGALLEGVPAREIQGIPLPRAEALVTAHEVSPEWHVRIQAAFQQHVDNAVSKTVNLPAGASVADVDKVFCMAFELGCKGTTVYRDGSRQGQTFSKASAKGEPPRTPSGSPRPRVRATAGKTIKFRMGCGTLFVTVNHDEHGLCEVFANLGKAGGCPSQSEATCRAVSVALRSGVEPRALIEQLRGIRCPSTLGARKNRDDVDVLSCPDAIARAMEEGIGGPVQTGPIVFGNACPDCGAQLRKQEGCLVCACGFSRCG